MSAFSLVNSLIRPGMPTPAAIPGNTRINR